MARPMRITERSVGGRHDPRARRPPDPRRGDFPLRDYVNRLVEQGRVKIVLDLGNVTRLDSAGIGMLVSKYLSASARAGAEAAAPDRRAST